MTKRGMWPTFSTWKKRNFYPAGFSFGICLFRQGWSVDVQVGRYVFVLRSRSL